MEFTLDEFNAKARMHCAPLLIVESKIPLMPRASDPSATITFIKHHDRILGITCRHVVETLKEKNSANPFAYTFFVALKNHVIVQDRFIVPSSDWVTPKPDIAIRELHPELPEHLGKIPLDITHAQSQVLSAISHAVAVGFPDRMKEERPENGGYRLAMSCVHAAAENRSHQGHSFSLYSELENTPAVRDLSGMSGGPIYWADETGYGLLGITYESTPLEGSLGGSNSIHIKGHLADRETLERWIGEVPRLYSP